MAINFVSAFSIIGFKGEIMWDASKPDGTLKKLSDISRIRSLGWEPKIALEDGIIKVYTRYVGSLNKE